MKNIRKPKVENKYNLKPSDINKLIVLDRTELDEAFFRNDNREAFYMIKDVGESFIDFLFGRETRVSIIIYDENAKENKNQIKYSCKRYKESSNYEFNEFFNLNEIENLKDLKSQEFLLRTINELIDLGILGLPE